MIPEAAVEADMFGPTSCPLDAGRHEVYSDVTPRLALYCRKCGKRWAL